jgi:hypothetical protein
VAAAGGIDPRDEEDPLDWASIGQKTGVRWRFTSGGMAKVKQL